MTDWSTSAWFCRLAGAVCALVVAPGFIDLHQHAQDSVAYTVLARAG